MLKVGPCPVAGNPPVAVHANVNGEVPPVPVALQETAVPTVPVVGQLIDTASPPVIVIVAEFDAVLAFASVTVTLTVLMLTVVNVVEKVARVAVELTTPLTDHAYL